MDTQAFANIKSLSLLYVEDDPATREEMAIMLEPWVGKLHVAVDGRDGLDVFKAFRPDIVVTDIQMPRVSGLAMSGEIRRIAPGQPIVVVSAYNDVEYLFRAIELGIDHYITKPVNFERLLEKLAVLASVLLSVRERQRNQVLLEQYKQLVDQNAIVCKFDPAGRITYVNDKLCEISGFAALELIGRDVATLRHASEPNRRCQEIFARVRAGEKWSGVVRNGRRDGGMYVVESSLVPVVDERGEVTEIVSLDVDITQVYENYENLVTALHRSHFSLTEQRHFLGEYKRALELSTCICVADRELRVISVNKHFEAVLGQSSVDLQGKAVQQFAPELSCDSCLADINAADQGRFTNRVVRFRSVDGEDLQFSIGCVGVRDLSGELESIIIIGQDITESLRLSRDIVETQRELLYAAGDAMENRSEDTAQHARRVAQVSKFLALQAGLDPETAEMIETAAPIHDVGKIGIRDAVLRKLGKLDPAEYEEMKGHAEIGHAILGKEEHPLTGLAATIAHQHHERYDGKGYPFGLKAEEISIAARIVAIADVLDALSSPRAYKAAWDAEQVMEYFRAERGQQFDPRLVDLLMANWDRIVALRNGGASM
jgi:PAS domain S-box-containing protein